MKLLSINVGSKHRLGDLETGIFKQPVKDRIEVSELGLPNDAICDVKYHGGVDQAIYVYGGDDYEYWLTEHKMQLDPGTFGENLVISELSSRSVSVGDCFQMGDVLLEATAPRIPCGTLGQKMQDPKFPIAFRRSLRSGFYCRVKATGELEAGMNVTYLPNEGSYISIEELFELNYNPKPSQEEFKLALQSPIAIRERHRLTALQEKLSV